MRGVSERIINRSSWYVRALQKLSPPAQITEPKAGYYKRRFVRGGPWVPARIWIVEFRDPETHELTADQIYYCDVGGEPKDAFSQWVNLLGHPIEKAEFDKLMAARDWAVSPRTKLDPNTSPPVF